MMLSSRHAIMAAFAVGLAGAAAPHAALAARPTTLTQALAEAYANNAMLQEARASLRATDEGVPTALSGWRPTIEIQAQAGRSNGVETLRNINPEAQIDSNLPPYASNTYKQDRTTDSAQITLQQDLWNGGKTTNSVREARNSVYSARALLLATEEQVFLQVVQAYVAVISQQQVLALQQSNVQVLERQLDATREQLQVGDSTETDVAQAQAAVAQAEAQLQIAVGQLQVDRETFRQLVGDYPGNLAPPQPLDLPVHSKAASAGAAAANNPTVVQAEFAQSAAKDAINVAFAALAPDVSVEAVGATQSTPDVFGSGTAENVRDAEILGNLTVPLYQGGAEYAAIRMARAKYQQAIGAVIDAKRTAVQQATAAWESLISSRQSIVSTNTAIKADAIALDGTERQQIVGTRTTLDVLNAQQLLLQAETQQVQNVANLVVYSYTIASAIGRLTSKDLALPVKEYDDLDYYDRVQYAGFGTGEAADAAAGLTPDGALAGASPQNTMPHD
jgi:outer membrane protein